MGFSTIGATVILFAGLLFFSSAVANSIFEAQRDTTQSLDEKRDRTEFAHGVQATIAANHAAGTLHINVTNTGTETLDGSKVNLIVDGAWSTDTITSRQVGGVTTDVWAPGEVIYIQATQGSQPSRALVVLETGKTLVWTP